MTEVFTLHHAYQLLKTNKELRQQLQADQLPEQWYQFHQVLLSALENLVRDEAFQDVISSDLL